MWAGEPMRCLTHTEVKSALSASWAYGADLIRVFYMYTVENLKELRHIVTNDTYPTAAARLGAPPLLA